MTTVVLVQQGGTGANNAADARGALGAAPLAAYDQANAAFIQANAAFSAANNAQVTVYANNSSNVTTQNVNFVNTSTVTVTVTADGSNANVAFVAAPQTVVNDTYTAAGNTAAASTANIANGLYFIATSAYEAANNSNLKSGGLVSGTLNVTQDLIVGGNIYLEGNTTFINVATYSVQDPLIYLASNNDLTDSVDIGFMGGKNTSGTYSHTGFARDATDGKWKLFDGLAEEGHVGNVIDFANTYLATLVANVEANTLSVVNGVTGNVNFDSGTLFVDSVGNRVGVGTTSPSSLLNLRSSNPVIQLTDSDTSASAYLDYQAGTSLKLHAGGDLLAFIAGNAERARITAGGNVGIGTTNPVASLTISNGGASGLELFHSGAVGGGPYIQAYNRSTSAYMHLTNYALSHTWYVGGTRAIDLDSSGNVGIGTSSPTARLDVRTAAGTAGQFNLYSGNNSTNTKISIGQIGAIDWDIGINASSGNFYIGGLGGSVSEAYRIQRTGTSVDTHRWSTGAAAERMFLNSSGILILGNTASSGTTGGALFNIRKPIDSGASVNYAIHINDPSTNISGGVSLIGWSHNVNDYTDVNIRAAIGATIDSGGAGSLVFRTGGYGSQSEKMRINSSGNVGIGNTAPGSKLTVAGTVESTSGGIRFPDGTTQSSAATGAPTQNVVSGTTVTAIKDNHYILTNASATTVTLPAAPANGDIVWVTVVNGRVDNVIARNGKLLQGLSEDLTLDNQNYTAQLRFINDTYGWRLL